MFISSEDHDSLYNKNMTYEAHLARAAAGGFVPLKEHQFNIVIDDIMEQTMAETFGFNTEALVK